MIFLLLPGLQPGGNMNAWGGLMKIGSDGRQKLRVCCIQHSKLRATPQRPQRVLAEYVFASVGEVYFFVCLSAQRLGDTPRLSKGHSIVLMIACNIVELTNTAILSCNRHRWHFCTIKRCSFADHSRQKTTPLTHFPLYKEKTS